MGRAVWGHSTIRIGYEARSASVRRGAESFRNATGNTALGHAASALEKVRRQYGPESIAGLAHGLSSSHVEHFVRSLGSPNVADPSYAECRGARDLAWTLTYGHEYFSPESSDMANAKMIVLLGYHLGENMHNTQVQDLTDALRKRSQTCSSPIHACPPWRQRPTGTCRCGREPTLRCCLPGFTC